MKSPLALICAALVAMCAPASAQSTDPGIVFVASAGHWETAEASGGYRIVVRQQGYEHVSSAVVAEWIAAPADAGTASRVAFSRQLAAPGMISFGQPMLTPRGDRVRVELKGTHAYALNDVSCTFELSPSGEVKIIQACD